MEITNLNNLVFLAREEHQTKLATGLMIASLVSHKNNGIQSWDVAWKSGILTVNHLPSLCINLKWPSQRHKSPLKC
jgi:hypothetical protein